MNDKIHIWKEQSRSLWWMRCDVCLKSSRAAFTVSRCWESTLQSARRHAAAYHHVKI